MNKLVGLAAAVALSLGSVTAAQATGLTFSVGQSGDSTMVYRLGAQFDFNSRWFESSVGHLGGYWDAGYTYWQGDDTSTNHSVSLRRYSFTSSPGKPSNPTWRRVSG